MSSKRVADIEQAMVDWRSGRAYWNQDERMFRAGKSNPGNYHIKAPGRSTGPVAPWNQSVKLTYDSVKDFHTTCMMLAELAAH